MGRRLRGLPLLGFQLFFGVLLSRFSIFGHLLIHRGFEPKAEEPLKNSQWIPHLQGVGAKKSKTWPTLARSPAGCFWVSL